MLPNGIFTGDANLISYFMSRLHPVVVSEHFVGDSVVRIDEDFVDLLVGGDVVNSMYSVEDSVSVI